MKNTFWLKIIGIVVLLAILVAIPYVAPNLYILGVVTTMLSSVLLAVSLWFILSTGQVTLGHAGFAAIGGYVCAAMVTAYGLSWWISMPVAIVAAAIVAAVVGFITLRITGVYFIVTTLALGEVIRIVFSMIDQPFGGLVGILGVPAVNSIGGISFDSKAGLYYLTLVFVIICLVIMYRIQSSHIGLVFKGIMQADQLAEHVGINIMWYKVLAFTIGSACAGLAGVLMVQANGSIMPTSFTLSQSIYYLVYVAVGGAGSIAAPILGAVVMSVLSELLRPIIEYAPLVFAIILIIFTLYFKAGLWGLVQGARGLLMRVFNPESDQAARTNQAAAGEGGSADTAR